MRPGRLWHTAIDWACCKNIPGLRGYWDELTAIYFSPTTFFYTYYRTPSKEVSLSHTSQLPFYIDGGKSNALVDF
jgi:hypothetical protein